MQEEGKVDDIRALETWMRERGVQWKDSAVALSRDSSKVIHGLGVIATRDLVPGEELFRIPRRACFGATLGGHDSKNTISTGGGSDDQDEDEDELEPEEVDCQKDLALKLLEELDLGDESEWAPLVKSLPCVASFGEVPFLFSASALECLSSTELHLPVQRKLERLDEEYASLSEEQKGRWSAELYRKACGVVMSHLNPWFETSIVPFVYVLNCPANLEPNVEFGLDEDSDEIVGLCLSPVVKGTELVQSYGNDLSSAELLYRCGFVLPEVSFPDEAVSFDAGQLVPEQVADQAARVAMLEEAGVVEMSPWQGLEDKKTVQIEAADPLAGIAKIITALLVGNLSEPTWQAAAQATTSVSVDSDKLDDMDKAAVRLLCLLHAAAEETVSLTDVAKHVVNEILSARESCCVTGINCCSAEAGSQEPSEKASCAPVQAPEPSCTNEAGCCAPAQAPEPPCANEAGCCDAGTCDEQDEQVDPEGAEEYLWEALVDTVLPLGTPAVLRRLEELVDARTAALLAQPAPQDSPSHHLQLQELELLFTTKQFLQQPQP